MEHGLGRRVCAIGRTVRIGTNFGIVALFQRLSPKSLKPRRIVSAFGTVCQTIVVAAQLRGMQELMPSHKKQDVATLDETGLRKLKDRRNAPESKASMDRRQGMTRRRQIDPTTCERDYSEDELEFMRAVDEYKRKNRRMFPTCSELLEVLRDLGYQKVAQASAEAAVEPTATTTVAPLARLTPADDASVLV